jgi:hypothetical protein
MHGSIAFILDAQKVLHELHEGKEMPVCENQDLLA